MPSSSYPHMIFATDAAELDKDRLVALLGESAPGGEAEQSSIKVTWTRDGYVWTFWFEDADRVGEMYADYLPEGIRRRPLVSATTVIDMSGALDDEGLHAAEATAIVDHLAAQEGVHVFSEGAKRFVGMTYGDEPAPVEEPTPDQTPAPVEEPTRNQTPAPVEPATKAPPVEVAAPEPAPAPTAEPREPEQQDQPEDKGFFKRLFGRR